MTETTWIFGYGSLIWRPDFAHEEARPASVEGWSRRFWQGSTDHRGVPGAPGRVVTLVEEPGARCWGMAYRVEADRSADVIARLDYREKGGYRLERMGLSFAGAGDDGPAGLAYIAVEGNPNYLGPAPLEAIAAQVRGSRGPSGHNVEYVVRLAEALRRIGADDPHVFALEALLGQGDRPR